MTQPTRHDPVKHWPKFQSEKPRILLLTSQLFLMGELEAACKRLDVPHVFLDIGARELGLNDFVQMILGAITSYKPDFVFTVNHLGVDREGVLLQILEALDVPLASWFVDNPSLILPVYPRQYTDRTQMFTWDADSVDALKDFGYPNVAHLPLGTDVERFKPGVTGKDEWRSDISFVGNSMCAKIAGRTKAAEPGERLLAALPQIAAGFGPSEERSPARYLLSNFPDLKDDFIALASPARMLAFETLVTWKSTQEYRLDCVRQTLGHKPLIVGDEGWKDLLGTNDDWTYHSEVAYYDELPGLYPLAKVNFNATSLQMKGAVNQRVFDVPAAGAFLITDMRRQMETLFEPGTEVVTYEQPDEIPQLLDRYLGDDTARTKIIEAARKRVLAEHTYDHRLRTIIDIMRLTFEPAKTA